MTTEAKEQGKGYTGEIQYVNDVSVSSVGNGGIDVLVHCWVMSFKDGQLLGVHARPIASKEVKVTRR